MTSTLGRSVRHPPPAGDQLDPERFRILLGAATRVPAVVVAFVATFVTLTMVTADSDLTGIYAAIAGTWLALHQVPLTIDDATLGALPLLPTAIVVWRSVRVCAHATDSLVEHTERDLSLVDAARLAAATIVGPLTITVIALVVVQDASGVLPVSPPNEAAALAWVTGVYLLSALIGIGLRSWRGLCLRHGVPEWAVISVRPAVRALLGMLAMGALLTAVGLALSWGTVGDLLARGDDVSGLLGLTVMSILYLPNVVVAASAILAGSAVQFGDMTLSLFEATGGDVPALPVLGAIPEGPAGASWVVALAVPATVGALLGRFAAHRTLQALADGVPVARTDTALTVLAAAAQVGVGTAVLTWVASGSLGRFGTVGANWWLAGILMFAWTGLLGLITAQLLMWREGRLGAAAARAATEADLVGDPDDGADPDDLGDPDDRTDPDEQKALGPGASDEHGDDDDPDDDPDPDDDADSDDADPDDDVIETEVIETEVIDAEIVEVEVEDRDAGTDRATSPARAGDAADDADDDAGADADEEVEGKGTRRGD